MSTRTLASRFRPRSPIKHPSPHCSFNRRHSPSPGNTSVPYSPIRAVSSWPHDRSAYSARVSEDRIRPVFHRERADRYDAVLQRQARAHSWAVLQSYPSKRRRSGRENIRGLQVPRRQDRYSASIASRGYCPCCSEELRVVLQLAPGESL